MSISSYVVRITRETGNIHVTTLTFFHQNESTGVRNTGYLEGTLGRHGIILKQIYGPIFRVTRDIHSNGLGLGRLLANCGVLIFPIPFYGVLTFLDPFAFKVGKMNLETPERIMTSFYV